MKRWDIRKLPIQHLKNKIGVLLLFFLLHCNQLNSQNSDRFELNDSFFHLNVPYKELTVLKYHKFFPNNLYYIINSKEDASVMITASTDIEIDTNCKLRNDIKAIIYYNKDIKDSLVLLYTKIDSFLIFFSYRKIKVNKNGYKKIPDEIKPKYGDLYTKKRFLKLKKEHFIYVCIDMKYFVVS